MSTLWKTLLGLAVVVFLVSCSVQQNGRWMLSGSMSNSVSAERLP